MHFYLLIQVSTSKNTNNYSMQYTLVQEHHSQLANYYYYYYYYYYLLSFSISQLLLSLLLLLFIIILNQPIIIIIIIYYHSQSANTHLLTGSGCVSSSMRFSNCRVKIKNINVITKTKSLYFTIII